MKIETADCVKAIVEYFESTSDEEKEKESKSLMDARLLRIKNLSEKQIEEAKKLQIKLKLH